MPSSETYRAALRDLPAADWEPYLLAHSNLPGPRGNLELAAAVADAGTEAQFRRWAGLDPDVAPENTPGCFLAFCGVVGLGAIMARGAGRGEVASPGLPYHDRAGKPHPYERCTPSRPTRAGASARGWRWRCSAGAMRTWPACWRRCPIGRAATHWDNARPPRRCASPRLLKQPEHAAAVLRILDEITASIALVTDHRSDAFKTLRQGLGYCWSVATAALPEIGKPLMERWLDSPDPDIRWIMRENPKKNRLIRMDAEWVARWRG